MTQFSESFHAVPFSDTSYQFGLTANTSLTQLIPGTNQQTYRVQFRFPYNANVWVGLNVSPTIPTGNVIAAAPACSLNPDFTFVRAGDTLYFKSGSNVTDCGFELLTLGQ